MRSNPLALAGAASLLMAGAAYAQLGTSATPNTGVLPNRPTPAPVQPGTTGIPSPDSTRVTGADAGKTNLPGGQLSGGTGASTTNPAAKATNPPLAYPSTGAEAAQGVNSSTTTQDATAPTPASPEKRKQ